MFVLRFVRRLDYGGVVLSSIVLGAAILVVSVWFGWTHLSKTGSTDLPGWLIWGVAIFYALVAAFVFRRSIKPERS